jgi:hypothetical protein
MDIGKSMSREIAKNISITYSCSIWSIIYQKVSAKMYFKLSESIFEIISESLIIRINEIR